jgi:hypothetical protein
MLHHAKAQRWQIEHLPVPHPAHHRPRQVAAAARAPLGRVHHHLVGVGHLGQMCAGAPGLLTGPAPAGPLLPCGGWALGKAIRGWRLGGDRGVLGKPALQFRNPALQLGDQPRLSALTARNSAMTAAWAVMVASRSRS